MDLSQGLLLQDKEGIKMSSSSSLILGSSSFIDFYWLGVDFGLQKGFWPIKLDDW